jgi:transcriptional regulator with GAF, ATPase, and Fis domain
MEDIKEIDGKYSIIKSLGGGGFSDVYLVETGGVRLALKLLKMNPRPAVLTEFRHEFGVLKEMRHPNISTILDFGFDVATSRHYYTQELIEGKDLLTAMTGLGLDEILGLFVQVVRALDYLHSYGVYHFDIKAANVLIVGGEVPSAKLIDFGLAGLSEAGRLIGTPSYMAPEIAMREKADGRADIYSLGILMYHALVGHNPFRAATPKETMDRQVHFMPKAPSEARPDIPVWLGDIVMRMIEKNPLSRYARPSEIIRDINWFGKKDFPVETLATLKSYMPEGRFIGRLRQMEDVDLAVARLREGKSSCEAFVIEGQRGTGKSRFLTELKYRYQLKDIRVELALASDRGAVDALLKNLNNHVARGIGIRMFFIDCAEFLLGDTTTKEAIVSAVIKAGSARASSKALIAISFGDEGFKMDQKMAGLFANRISIDPFTKEEVEKYLVTLIGISSPPESISSEIYARTDGNPLLITELVNALIESGGMLDSFGRWNAHLFEDIGVDFSKAGISRAIADLMLKKIAGLPEAGRAVLEALSAVQSFVSTRCLELVCGVPDIGGSVSELIRMGLVERNEGYECAIKNKMMSDVLYKSLGDKTKASMHDKFSAYYRSIGDRGRELWHLARGSDRDKAASALIELGDFELARGNGKAAADEFAKAMNLIPDEDSQAIFGLNMKLGEAHLISRDYDAAVAVFNDAEGAVRSAGRGKGANAPVADAMIRLAGTYMKLHMLDKARESLAAARAATAGLGDLTREIVIGNFEAEIELQGGRYEKARDEFRALRARQGELPAGGTTRIKNNDLATALIMCGDIDDAIKVLNCDMRFAREVDDNLLIARVHYNFALVYTKKGQREEAFAAYRECIEACRRVKDVELMLRAYNGLGNLYNLSGDMAKALECYEMGFDLNERSNDLRGGAAIAVNIGIALNALGRMNEAMSRLCYAVNFLKSVENPDAADRAAMARGQIEIASILKKRMQVDDAISRLDDAVEIAGDIKHDALKFWAMSEQSEIFLEKGDIDQSMEAIDALRPLALSETERQRVRELEDMIGEKNKKAGTPEVARPAEDAYAKILEINKLIAAERDMDYVLKTVLFYALELSGAEAGAILLLDDKGELQIVCRQNMDDRGEDSALSRTVAMAALTRGEPVLTDDAMADEKYAGEASISANRLRSILCMPIKSKRKAIGVLYLDHRFEAAAFSKADLKLLDAFADQMGLAIESAKRLSELTGEEQRLKDKLDEASKRVERYEEIARTAQPAIASEYGRISGRSEAMRKIIRTMEKIADTDISVFICGESGTGKELIAKALHDNNSSRKDKKFVAINCGAIPATLIESELFGYKAGAFTGANKDKRGLVEEANGGTLFLDEISTLDVTVQAKLLRVIQERECMRLGDIRPIPVDIRIVSASNERIEELVRDGGFREDLFYRICQIKIDVPPLRDRPEDLAFLAKKFLEEAAPGKGMSISPQFMRRMLEYDWPGNVRELENLMQVASALAEGDVIDEHAIPDNHPLMKYWRGEAEVQPKGSGGVEKAIMVDEKNPYDVKKPWKEYEAVIIAKCLAANGFNARASAAELGMSAATIYKRIEELGLKDEHNKYFSDGFEYARGRTVDDYLPMVFKAALDAADGKACEAISNLRVSQGYFYKVMKKAKV